jgi:hypothetical protein
VWVGDTITPDLNRCGVHLEVKLSDDTPRKLKGYLMHRCASMEGLKHEGPTRAAIDRMIRDQTQPDSIVMTGTPAAEGISFAVDQTLSISAGKCGPMSSFNITDFGSGQVMAQWQEGSCDPTRMLLKRGR